jgi:hypothetical protein
MFIEEFQVMANFFFVKRFPFNICSPTEAQFRNTHMSTREQKCWSWISKRLKPRTTVLVKASIKLSDRLAVNFFSTAESQLVRLGSQSKLRTGSWKAVQPGI